MPSTESVQMSSTRGVSAMTPADTPATSGPDASDMALPPGAPDTVATRALWAALGAHVTATAAELASTAGVSRSTANKTLAILEEAGLATRTAGAREGTQRLPDQWRAVIRVEPVEPAATELAIGTTDVGSHTEAPVSDQYEGAHRDEATEPNEAMAADLPTGDSAEPPASGSAKARLGTGQLREMVLAHLREHSDEDFTPPALSKVLARSLGAIANACEKLATEGAIAQTSERPQVPLCGSCVAIWPHRVYHPRASAPE